MGLLFRKSFKVAPGIKFNIGKKSIGISVGGKHGGASYNTKSGVKGRVSIPGTGLSYQVSPKKSKKKGVKTQKSYKKTSKYDIRILQREVEILNNCAQIFQSTSNPDTFFSRYDLYIQKLTLLSDAERDGINFEGDSPSKKLSEVTRDHGKIELVNNMIDRCWAKTISEIQNLKTDNGKKNRVLKFKDNLSKYDSQMPQASIYYYKSKMI